MKHVSVHTTPWVRLDTDLLGDRRVVTQRDAPVLPVREKTPEEIAAVKATLAGYLDEVASRTAPLTRPQRPMHLPDEVLLEQYERLARGGNAAAQFRADALRVRLGLD